MSTKTVAKTANQQIPRRGPEKSQVDGMVARTGDSGSVSWTQQTQHLNISVIGLQKALRMLEHYKSDAG